jgi:LysR family glycine cleavage system transcriptional activator
MNNSHEIHPAAFWAPPPLSALRAFEAAARTLSFTKAASELGLTQSAVSHAIRQMEERLAAPLFRRNGRRLDLSDAGKRYAPYVSEALAKLRAGDIAVTDPDRRARVLTVSVSPSFAAKWLAPRIGEFAAIHPDLDLRISATPLHVDFVDGDIDLAIRHGDGKWRTLDAVRLCSEWWMPVCSPALITGSIGPDDLRQYRFIHHRDASAWRRWFDHADVDAFEEPEHGLTFNELSLAIDAAVSGQGVALARSALAARDLLAGRLICPVNIRQDAELGYWIVRPKDRPRTPKIARFIDWLLREAAADEKAMEIALA